MSEARPNPRPVPYPLHPDHSLAAEYRRHVAGEPLLTSRGAMAVDEIARARLMLVRQDDPRWNDARPADDTCGWSG